jgi:lipid-binding SYLF domain-containing protein
MQGLFFYHTRKVGLGIGVKWGAGVLFTHLTDARGRTGWSAPALYRVKEAALGLIAGARSAVARPAHYSREPGFKECDCTSVAS